MFTSTDVGSRLFVLFRISYWFLALGRSQAADAQLAVMLTLLLVDARSQKTQ